MPRKIQQGENGAGFECIVPDDVLEIFAEGISEVQYGIPFTRLIFHTTQAPATETALEQRIAKLSVVFPTAPFLELVANIATETTKEVKETTQQALGVFVAQVSAQLDRMIQMKPPATEDNA